MDIYQINSVMHGDCVALMSRMESESHRFHSHGPALHHALSLARWPHRDQRR